MLTHSLHGLLGHILECVAVLLCLGILTRGSLYGFSEAECALSLLIHEASIFLGVCCKLVILREPAMELRMLTSKHFLFSHLPPADHVYSHGLLGP